MKNAKKIFAVLVVLALAISMAIPVSADEPTGKITIEDAVAGQTYSAYKMADLTTDGNAYSYTVAAGWDDFFKKDEVKAVYTVDANGVITEVSPAPEQLAKKLAEVAKLAVEYAKGKGKDATKTAIANDAGKAEMTEVPYGYYCVDTTTGTVCSIGSVDGNEVTGNEVTIVEKNTVPHIDKSIVEGNQKLKVSDAYIGQVVKFEVVVDAYNGAENYIITDTLSDGLTFVKDQTGTPLADTDKLSDFIYITTKINPNPISIDESDDSQSLIKGNKIVIDLSGEDELTKDLDKGKSTPITLTYYAKVNAQAVIDGPNPNTVSLKYGNNSDANSDIVNLYPLSFNIEKVDGSNNNKPLPGAQFEIYKDSTNPLTFDAVMKTVGEDEVVDYYLYNPNGSITSLTDVDGKYTIKGVDLGTYTIKEVVAPTGYNAITTDAEITISLIINPETATVQPETVTVQNFTGALLPYTGATGKVVFIAVGSVLVLVVGVLLIVRKRMTKLVYTK